MMRLPFAASITYTAQCGICGVKTDEMTYVGYRMELPLPSLPDGWHVVDGTPYCRKHTVVLETGSERIAL